MQLEFWIEIIYDNFLIVFWLGIGCILFTLVFSGWIMKHKIGTKVLVVRKATGSLISASENIGESTVKFDNKLYKIYQKDSPSFMQSLLRPYRLYIHPEGSDYVFSPQIITHIKGLQRKDDDIAFQKILQAEVIQQSVRGLVGSLLEKLIYMGAGGCITIIIWEIIRGVFGG